MNESLHRTAAELEAGLPQIQQAPASSGVLQRIVRRPATNGRQELAEGRLDPATGLEGDCWAADPQADVEAQVTLMNARVIALIAATPERWALAGDQLYVDFDLSAGNVPAGTRLAIGAAVIEVTAPPHLGCRKFRDRYGRAAMQFVNSPTGRQLNLRGVNARVIEPGTIRIGDAVRHVG